MEPTRRLVRSRDDRILGGVCGGIAEHFGVDPTIVRIAVIALTLFGGAGVLLYLVAWVMIPEEGTGRRPYATWSRRRRARSIVGLVLIAIALSSISHLVWPFGDFGFPVFLIALGAFLLWSSGPRRDLDDDLDEGPEGGAPASQSPATSTVTPSPTDATVPMAGPAVAATTVDVTAEAPTTEVPAADATTELPATATGTTAREWHREWHRQQRTAGQRYRAEQQRNLQAWKRRRARRRSRRSLTGPTAGVLAIGAGATGIALASGASVDAATVLAIGLVIVGAALVAATVMGRAGGLVPLGLVLLGALTVVTAVSVPFEGGIGRRTVLPASVDELRPAYHLAIGQLELGLGAIRPASGTTVSVQATVGIGHLVVSVPRDVEVTLQVHADMGGVRYAGIDDGGWQVDGSTVVHRGQEGAGRIALDAEVGVGQVEVRDA